MVESKRPSKVEVTLVRDVPPAVWVLALLPVLIYVGSWWAWFRSETGIDRNVGRPEVGIAFDPVGHDGDRAAPQEPARGGIVSVQEPPDGMVRREEDGLRLQVALHRPVVVEVVLGEVREDSEVEHDPVDAMLSQRVRRDLHRDDLHPGRTHPREQTMQVRGLGCGPGELARVAVDPCAVRTDHARA